MHPVLSPEHPLGGQQAGLQLLADVELRAGGLLAVVAGPGARVQGPGGHRVGGVSLLQQPTIILIYLSF